MPRPPCSSPLRFDEQKVDELLGAIGRLREERDDLKSHLEFAQMEAHFEIEALRKQLAQSQSDSANNPSQAQLSKSWDGHVEKVRRLNTALSAFIVTAQHLDGQNGELAELLEETTRLEASMQASASEEVSSLQTKLAELEQERFRLSAELANAAEQSRQGFTNLQNELSSLRHALTSKEDELVDVNLKLRDATESLQQEKVKREALETQLRDLEVDCNTIKQELADALDNCERLEARQAASMSSDAVTKSMRAEVEELKARVLRRTEQIGLQQHDIKRLETNLRLTEETLEETRNELEVARTENEAMLDDCSTSRNEREEAQRALIQSELEVERLTTLMNKHTDEIESLKSALSSLENEAQAAETARSQEIAVLKASTEEASKREATLTEKLTDARKALEGVQHQVTLLTTELATAKELSQRLASESKSRAATDSAEMEVRSVELEQLRDELSASKASYEEIETVLKAAEN